jgi:hypothetical protein
MPPFINFSLRIFWPLVNEIFEINLLSESPIPLTSVRSISFSAFMA